MDLPLYIARIGTTALLSTIIILFFLMATSVRRMSGDLVRARISLHADLIKRGVLALLGGFSFVLIVSLSYLVQGPLEGLWEMPILYAWLSTTLYGSYQFFQALYLPRKPKPEVN